MKTSFTTEPKTRRHGHFTSGTRARAFMHHLWDKGLHKDVSYETLITEFRLLYEPGRRTLDKYCGVPPHVIHATRRHMSRMNSRNGVTAQFNYSYTRNVPKKPGLLEQLGFITWKRLLWEETKHLRKGKQYRYRLNHEMMPYYTEQIELDVSPHDPPIPESLREEVPCSDGASIDNLCVYNTVLGSDGVADAAHGNDDVDDDVYTTTREERESISITHANRLGETNISEAAERVIEIESEGREREVEDAHTYPYYAANMNREVCDVESRGAE